VREGKEGYHRQTHPQECTKHDGKSSYEELNCLYMTWAHLDGCTWLSAYSFLGVLSWAQMDGCMLARNILLDYLIDRHTSSRIDN
jgi:hypothetical protein